jgi:hypothetical protein
VIWLPNRIIKESIARSEKISGLTDFQFRLWIHLITYVDDYGRGDARPAIIRGACFPLRDRVSNKDIEAGICGLADIGCVSLYNVDGRPYLCLPGWDEHQRVRQKVSKYPSPEDADPIYHNAADGCELPQSAARIQNPNPESRIQNPNPESRIQNPNPESRRAQAHEDDFERFWSMYPRKEGKQKAKTAFAKVDVDIDTLLDALSDHKKSAQWTKNNGEFIPHASTWLNGRRWEDQMSQNYDKVPKGASGVIGEAEAYFIQRALREE